MKTASFENKEPTMNIIDAINQCEDANVAHTSSREFATAARQAPAPFNDVHNADAVLMWRNSVAATCIGYGMDHQNISAEDVVHLTEDFFQSAATSYLFAARLVGEAAKQWGSGNENAQ